jgi:hypothetical protein
MVGVEAEPVSAIGERVVAAKSQLDLKRCSMRVSVFSTFNALLRLSLPCKYQCSSSRIAAAASLLSPRALASTDRSFRP